LWMLPANLPANFNDQIRAKIGSGRGLALI
jgi:hypothetical protein